MDDKDRIKILLESQKQMLFCLNTMNEAINKNYNYILYLNEKIKNLENNKMDYNTIYEKEEMSGDENE